MTTRVATTAVSPSFTPNAKVHAARPLYRVGTGWVLGCNGRFVRHCDTYAPEDFDRVLAGPFGCKACTKGLASGRIVKEDA